MVRPLERTLPALHYHQIRSRRSRGGSTVGVNVDEPARTPHRRRAGGM